MTRRYADELCNRPLDDDACPVCGLSYAKELKEDRKSHRSDHTRTLSVLEPKSNKALAKSNAKSGRYVPVTATSPFWMRRRLRRIAETLVWENGYDIAMWDITGDDGHGFILTDNEGRALGGCVVRWREYTNAPACWVLQWIWIAPPYRRQGLLRDTWSMVTGKYQGIIPEEPYSPAAARFILSLGNMPDYVYSWACQALKD